MGNLEEEVVGVPPGRGDYRLTEIAGSPDIGSPVLLFRGEGKGRPGGGRGQEHEKFTTRERGKKERDSFVIFWVPISWHGISRSKD